MQKGQRKSEATIKTKIKVTILELSDNIVANAKF
jgi:hypothetical protein